MSAASQTLRDNCGSPTNGSVASLTSCAGSITSIAGTASQSPPHTEGADPVCPLASTALLFLKVPNRHLRTRQRQWSSTSASHVHQDLHRLPHHQRPRHWQTTFKSPGQPLQDLQFIGSRTPLRSRVSDRLPRRHFRATSRHPSSPPSSLISRSQVRPIQAISLVRPIKNRGQPSLHQPWIWTRFSSSLVSGVLFRARHLAGSSAVRPVFLL
jgi:hypothetical protein